MMYERPPEDLGSTSMNYDPQEALYTGLSTQPSLESQKMKAVNNSFSTKLASKSTNMNYDNLEKDMFGQKYKSDADYDNLMSEVEKGELDAMKPEVSSFKLLVTYVFDFDLELTESLTKNDLCDVSVSGLLGFSNVKEEEAVSDDKDVDDDDDDDKDTCDTDLGHDVYDYEQDSGDYDMVEVVEYGNESGADYDMVEVVENGNESGPDYANAREDQHDMKGSKNNLLDDNIEEAREPAKKDQLESDLEKILERLDIEEEDYSDFDELQLENGDCDNSEIGNSLTSIPSFDGQYHNSDMDSENDDDNDNNGESASSCRKYEKKASSQKSSKASRGHSMRKGFVYYSSKARLYKGQLCYSDRDVSEPSKKKYPLLKRIFLRLFPLRKYVLKHKNKDHAVK